MDFCENFPTELTENSKRHHISNELVVIQRGVPIRLHKERARQSRLAAAVERHDAMLRRAQSATRPALENVARIDEHKVLAEWRRVDKAPLVLEPDLEHGRRRQRRLQQYSQRREIGVRTK